MFVSLPSNCSYVPTMNRLRRTNRKERTIFHRRKTSRVETFPKWWWRGMVELCKKATNWRRRWQRWGKCEKERKVLVWCNKQRYFAESHKTHQAFRLRRKYHILLNGKISLLLQRSTKNETKTSTNDKMITELLLSTAYEVTTIVTNGRHYKVFFSSRRTHDMQSSLVFNVCAAVYSGCGFMKSITPKKCNKFNLKVCVFHKQTKQVASAAMEVKHLREAENIKTRWNN